MVEDLVKAVYNDRRMIVYLIENKRNGKRYVGLTKYDLETRWGQHVKDALYERSNMPLHRAIRKYGVDEFIQTVIDTGDSEEQLRDLEKDWIQALGTYENGYNATRGGDGVLGLKHSDETKKRMSEARKGERNPNYGKKGWIFNWANHPERLKEFSEGRIGEGNPMHGKHQSAEARKKIGEAQFKKVAQCDDEGRTIGVFNSVIEAATKLAPSENLIKSSRVGISRACKYPTRRALGFKWKYLKTDESQKG